MRINHGTINRNRESKEWMKFQESESLSESKDFIHFF